MQDRKITLYLDKVPLKKAMDKLFVANNLTYELDRDANIFIVKDWGKLRVETITKVFNLKYATVSNSALKKDASANIGSGYTGSGAQGGIGAGTTIDAGITDAVKKLLSEAGSVVEDSRTNSLVVTDSPERLEVIARVIASLDVPAPQVLLEVEMLDVSKNTVDKLGVNWPETLVKFTISGTKETNFPFGSDRSTKIGTRSIDPDKNSFGGNWDFGSWGASRFGPSILTLLGTTLTLDFLRTQTDTKFLARPKLLTLNNQTAEIRIATQESIGVNSVTAAAGGSAGTTAVSAERVETGVILRVTPQVNIDTGEITMFIYPKVADATGGNTITSAGSNYVYRDPEERSTKSMVRIKDGETVVLGGMLRNETFTVEKKLPFFSDIPIVGLLFRHKGGDNEKNKQRELMVFITPHIIRDNVELKLAQGRRLNSLEREQNTVSGASRGLEVAAALNSFEKKR